MDNQLHLTLSIHGGLVLGFLQIPKSSAAQVTYIKWWRTMHIVSPLHPRFLLWTENTVFNPWLVESTDAKPEDMED